MISDKLKVSARADPDTGDLVQWEYPKSRVE